jgi:rhodanese-related sulfurtransferase
MWLEELGYKNLVENAEGFAGWQREGLPTE